jgi:hypothetical protein
MSTVHYFYWTNLRWKPGFIRWRLYLELSFLHVQRHSFFFPHVGNLTQWLLRWERFLFLTQRNKHHLLERVKWRLHNSKSSYKHFRLRNCDRLTICIFKKVTKRSQFSDQFPGNYYRFDTSSNCKPYVCHQGTFIRHDLRFFPFYSGALRQYFKKLSLSVCLKVRYGTTRSYWA